MLKGSEHLVPTLDTLVVHVFPTLYLYNVGSELNHLLLQPLVEILQVTQTAPLHKVFTVKPHLNARPWVLFQGKLDGRDQDI